MDYILKHDLELHFNEYCRYLAQMGLSEITIKKYCGDIFRFNNYLNAHIINKIDINVINEYHDFLISNFKISTYNSYLISLNKYFKFLHKDFLYIKLKKIPQKSSVENVISINEYQALLSYTYAKCKYREHFLIKTLACTGIRISELKYITYESLKEGQVLVSSKGKSRIIYYSDKLIEELIWYSYYVNVDHGPVFCTYSSKQPLDQSNIWHSLKKIAKKAGVNPSHVYPHSFRHLFAKTYIDKFNSLDELADLLGHSSIETTRIYTRTSVEEKRERLNTLGLLG